MQPKRVDFYLLKDAAPDAVYQYACRLLEKIYMLGHRVYVYCADQHAAEHLDELLWTFRDDSFIPHHLMGEGPTPPPPVQIGTIPAPAGSRDILLNITHTTPDFIGQFRRILEIIPEDTDAKTIARARYQAYREKGWHMHIHNITTL